MHPMGSVTYSDGSGTGHITTTLDYISTSQVESYFPTALALDNLPCSGCAQQDSSKSNSWSIQSPTPTMTTESYYFPRSSLRSGYIETSSIDLAPEKRGSMRDSHRSVHTNDGASVSSASSSSSSPSHPRRYKSRLRTTAGTTRRPAHKHAGTLQEVQLRALHNQVEQQYRKRLNAHFEQLLAILPPIEHSVTETYSVGDSVGGGADNKSRLESRVSKGDVLDLARERINILERERERLEAKKKDLTETIGRLQY